MMSPCRPAVFLLLALPLLSGPAAAQPEPEVLLYIPPAAGEPGEEAAIEFRARFLRAAVVDAIIHFELSAQAADFIRTDISGTAAAHAPPGNLFYNPSFNSPRWGFGHLTGVSLPGTRSGRPIAAGEELVLVKAVVRVRREAATGTYPVKIKGATFTQAVELRSMRFGVEGDGALVVEPPGGPRPVGALTCAQEGAEVVLTWRATEGYEGVAIERNGTAVATVGGAETAYRDRPPVGAAAYEVTALRGGKASLPASCSLQVETPRPPPVRDLACAPAAGGFSLTWTNGTAYDLLAVFRNGRLVAELPGSSQSYADSYSSDLFTLYSVKGRAGGVETLPATCKLNEFSRHVMRAEEVRLEPGAERIPLRIFATNPEAARGFSVSLKIDPAQARIEEVRPLAPAGFFAYNETSILVGELTLGLIYDVAVPITGYLPAGADQAVLEMAVTVPAGAPRGTVAPVVFGNYGAPPGRNVFTTLENAHSEPAQTWNGAILIGDSPLPTVVGAVAEPVEESGPGGGQAEVRVRDIQLRWTNPFPYDSIRVERDGAPLVELPGGSTAHRDLEPGPGIHRYRISGRTAGLESFPVVVVVLPRGVPGTFGRGDANSDRRLNIADVVTIISYLFRGGEPLRCLDAADADDSGRVDITDPLAVIQHIFLGLIVLPPPGIDIPWFDPSEDPLGCE